MSITAKDLAVTVKITPAKMTSSIQETYDFVALRVKDYDIATYTGDMTELKADRAELNKAADAISRIRIDTIKDAAKPFAEFESIAKKAEKLIKETSGKIDEMIKAKEDEEAVEKQKKIQAYFDSIEFKLVAFEKIKEKVGDKWLNVTYKFADVKKDIDAFITKTRAELEGLAGMFDDKDLASNLKASYLETLDLGATILRGNGMKKAAELLAEDEKNRPEQIKKEEAVKAQNELDAEIKTEERSRHPASLAVIAAGNAIEPEGKKRYCIIIECTTEEKNAFKQFLIDRRLKFEQLATGEVYNG